ncbi:energy transducer TonB [Sphingomonas sp. LY54]|uniref:energy transducer TonB n=1 Tax=Sphingomonas sp. LY54 TaxID=3095343 RepID=UPI002D79F215|nr:energy transducer TonB [Sphingomonas sp. LY54]WRP29473.1 energy transducer TonB [Sphingomonas sp. LY54]
MTRRILCSAARLALAVLLAGGSATAYAGQDKADTRAREAKPIGGLVSLFRYEDYPTEALAKGEQGTTHFRLTIGTDGRVSRCAITQSSGHVSLDEATCGVMTKRARFRPALDADGKPTVGTAESRVTWRSPGETDVPRIQPPASVTALMQLWSACIVGEAAKLAPLVLAEAELVAKAIDGCTGLERLAAAEMTRVKVDGLDPAAVLPSFKSGFAPRAIGDLLAKTRPALPPAR